MGAGAGDFTTNRGNVTSVNVETVATDWFLESFLGKNIQMILDKGFDGGLVFFGAVTPLYGLIKFFLVELRIEHHNIVAWWHWVAFSVESLAVGFVQDVEMFKFVGDGVRVDEMVGLLGLHGLLLTSTGLDPLLCAFWAALISCSVAEDAAKVLIEYSCMVGR